jgi:hypothetical protein
MDVKKPAVPRRKRAWQTPTVEELGNLRDFVREGNANGKSTLSADGTTSGNHESMPH